jgi:hypothetical protein
MPSVKKFLIAVRAGVTRGSREAMLEGKARLGGAFFLRLRKDGVYGDPTAPSVFRLVAPACRIARGFVAKKSAEYVQPHKFHALSFR